MSEWELTKQAKEFLINLEQALRLPTSNDLEHKWLQESIDFMRTADFSSKNYKKEIREIKAVLLKYSDSAFIGKERTSRIFYELYCDLASLRREKKIYQATER